MAACIIAVMLEAEGFKTGGSRVRKKDSALSPWTKSAFPKSFKNSSLLPCNISVMIGAEGFKTG